MSQSVKLRLFGSGPACSKAKAILENRSEIKRVEVDEKTGELSLSLSVRLNECAIVALLLDSGIAGFRIRQ